VLVAGFPRFGLHIEGLTRRLAEAAELLQIKLLDHIIIGAPAEGRQAYFSFKEAGVL
jgi:DNA repair protein RadC